MGILPNGTDPIWTDDGKVDIPPVAGSLRGETRADMVAHGQARAALLNILGRDPDVVALLRRWGEQTRVGQGVAQICDRLDRAASLAGFSGRGELCQAWATADDGRLLLRLQIPDNTADPGAAADRVGSEIETLLAEVERLSEAALDALYTGDWEAIAAEAVSLVRDTWHLPWSWLAWEIAFGWTSAALAAAMGAEVAVTFQVAPAWSMPAPCFAPIPSLEPRPGETITELLTRINAHVADIASQVIEPVVSAADAIPAGKRPDAEVIERFVEWWYRHRIRRESINSIAKHAETERNHVRLGIRRAEHWLGLAGSQLAAA